MTASSNTVRVASVQLRAEPSCFGGALYDRITYYVASAADYKADFGVFPELFTCLLLAAETDLPADQVTGTSGRPYARVLRTAA